MPIEWYPAIAVLCFIALALILYRILRRSAQPRNRELDLEISSPTVTRKTDWDKLTPRQQQVARLVARGLTNAEIAKQLHIESATVSSHLKNIYVTLGVHSRTELSYRIKDECDQKPLTLL
jgi:DNA-binding NarL/FixJ family response regulator